MSVLGRQPRSVKAIAFACVASYMGIGLVDPILPSIASSLDATPGQTELLFTTYLFTTAIVMFLSSWVSSRIGMKRTLLLGLALVVAFATACAASGSVLGVIGARGGWGVGNALFVSTALAAIIGSAAQARSAIVLYEAALGIGMAVGPLAGGLLGEISWRGPFIGTAVLISAGLVGIALSLEKEGTRPEPAPLADALRAIVHPGFPPVLLAAFFYNFGYFTILAFTPFPLHDAAALAGHDFTPIDLGLIFFGWGILLAAASVALAPWLSRRFGVRRAVAATMAVLVVDELAFALGADSLALVVAAALVSGVLLGVVNTSLTEVAMEATDLPRPVSSSVYSGVRFLGAALAPTLTGPLSEAGGNGLPYFAGALAVAGLALVSPALARRARGRKALLR